RSLGAATPVFSPACGGARFLTASPPLARRGTVGGLFYISAVGGAAPAVFVILVTGFIVCGAALIVEVLYSPPYWLHALLWGSLSILLPLILLRSFKGVLIALQFRHKAEEGKLAAD